MVILTESIIEICAKDSNLARITKFNCVNRSLSDISLLSRCINLVVVSLSANSITTLEPFKHCYKLRQLFLRKNEIKDVKEVQHLVDLPVLEDLVLSDNPCCLQPHYYSFIVKTLPNLVQLDNTPLLSLEAANFQSEQQPQQNLVPLEIKQRADRERADRDRAEYERDDRERAYREKVERQRADNEAKQLIEARKRIEVEHEELQREEARLKIQRELIEQQRKSEEARQRVQQEMQQLEQLKEQRYDIGQLSRQQAMHSDWLRLEQDRSSQRSNASSDRFLCSRSSSVPPRHSTQIEDMTQREINNFYGGDQSYPQNATQNVVNAIGLLLKDLDIAGVRQVQDLIDQRIRQFHM